MSILRCLRLRNLVLASQAEDPVPTIPLETHNTVLEVAEIFAVKYNELFAPRLPAFVRAVWEVIGASTLAVREDTTVSQAIKFLSITVKTGLHTQLFSQQETLELLIERIVLPNMLLRGEFMSSDGPSSKIDAGAQQITRLSSSKMIPSSTLDAISPSILRVKQGGTRLQICSRPLLATVSSEK
jgi:hypothetical protein